LQPIRCLRFETGFHSQFFNLGHCTLLSITFLYFGVRTLAIFMISCRARSGSWHVKRFSSSRIQFHTLLRDQPSHTMYPSISFSASKVKPVLKTTCKQRPHVDKDHVLFVQKTDLKKNSICEQRPPVFKDHFWIMPRVVFENRFDCKWKWYAHLDKTTCTV
jgi:hypothetical protein